MRKKKKDRTTVDCYWWNWLKRVYLEILRILKEVTSDVQIACFVNFWLKGLCLEILDAVCWQLDVTLKIRKGLFHEMLPQWRRRNFEPVSKSKAPPIPSMSEIILSVPASHRPSILSNDKNGLAYCWCLTKRVGAPPANPPSQWETRAGGWRNLPNLADQ